MAEISKVTIVSGTAIAETLTTGTDTLETDRGTLYVRNDSGVSANINIVGDGVTATEDLTGCGVGVFDATGGIDITVADGDTVPVILNDNSVFLKGDVVNVTGGGAGVFAYII
jgi:DNA/RNA endonuclease YhcR with UshA esterase domain